MLTTQRLILLSALRLAAASPSPVWEILRARCEAAAGGGVDVCGVCV